jgi:7-cyano-7-deazaguanine synthase in queuosine biosynthesis
LPKKPNVNIICYGAIPSIINKRYNISDNYLKLYLHGKSSNVNVANEFADYNSFLEGTLSQISKDIVDVAATIYLADRSIKKDDSEMRELNILLPVRRKEIWDNNKYLLKTLIEYLLRDNVNFYFEEKYDDEKCIQSNKVNLYDSVICFSGGLDSFIGSIKLIKDGYNPILLSHYSNPLLSGIQSNAYDALSKYLSKKIQHCKIDVSSSRSSKKGRRDENYRGGNPNQLSRSFLFLSLASVLANELNIKNIFLCENGILSINLPLSESRFNTRTAHPKFLFLFQVLINKLFQTKIKIENPFLYNTKSEILRNMNIDKIDLINKTISCWNYSRIKLKSKQSTHCGYCYPCIIRRISSKKAFPFEIERERTYWIDIFKEFPYESYRDNIKLEALFNIKDLISFSAQFKSLDEYDIQLEYPELFINLNNINSIEIVKMYKRFSEEVVSVINKHGNSKLKEFVSAALK